MPIEHSRVLTGENWYPIAKRLAPWATTAQIDKFARAIATVSGSTIVTPAKLGSAVHYDTADLPAKPVDPPPVVEPPPVVVPPIEIPTGKVPILSSCGPRGSLRLVPGGRVSGVVTGVKFTSPIMLAPDAQLTDCDLMAGFQSPSYPGNSPATLDHCAIPGWWFEDNNRIGADGIEGRFSVVRGGSGQAARHKGAGLTKWFDTWFISDQQPAAGAHTETIQMMYGSEIHAERCAISRRPVTNNTVTGVFTFEQPTDGLKSELIDCEFGYFNEATGKWERGGGVKMLYPGQAAWIRALIHCPPQEAWYSTPRVLEAPVYL